VAELTLTVEDVPRVRLLSARTIATRAELGERVGRLLAALRAAAGGRVDGPAVCVYPVHDDAVQVVAEPGVPYAGEPPYGYAISELPAGRAVVGRLTGPHDGLGDAWRATMAYVAQHGLRARGAPYERYRVAPGQAEPHALETELVVPVEP
jgi:effector-binding domain-containing protein